MLEDTWPGSEAALLDLERTLPECAEMSSVTEISSHVCESFLMNPGSMLECEQTVRRAHQSLGRAVDRLLEMVLASTRQVRLGPHARATAVPPPAPPWCLLRGVGNDWIA